MIFYSCVALVGVICAIVAQKEKQAANIFSYRLPRCNWKIWAFLSAVPFFLVMAFRYDVGTDYFFTYQPYFSGMVAGQHSTPDIEIGYWLINRFGLLFSSCNVWVFALSALVIIGFFWGAIWHLSPLPWFSVALFFLSRHFFAGMNIMRQYMAMAILLFACRYLCKPCAWKFFLLVVVAASFHKTALLFAAAYILIYLPITPKLAYILLTAGTLLRVPISLLLRQFLAGSSYESYLGSAFDATVSIYPQRFLILLLFFLIASYAYPKGQKADTSYQVFFSLLTIALFLSCNYNLFPQIERILFYFEMSNIIFLPMVVSRISDRNLRYILIGLICLVSTWFMLDEVIVRGSYEVIPYHCVFFPQISFF